MNIAPAFSDAILSGVNPGIYTQKDFEAIAQLVHAEAGIVLPPGKSMLVYSRIAPLVRESSSTTFAEYVEAIRSDAAQRKRTIEALTTNHTFFYREAHHFEHFAEQVRPALVNRLDRGQSVRIWSAGCSSGEEIWSLVVTLLGDDPVAARQLIKRDIRILASDLAPRVLRKAAAAEYSETEVKDVPAALRNNWLRTVNGLVTVAPEARELVRFRELNLLGEWPMRRPFDVIFCRNVMIYFDQPTKERLVARFADQLLPGGYLYIGHSERVSGRAATLLEPVGPTIYRRRDA